MVEATRCNDDAVGNEKRGLDEPEPAIDPNTMCVDSRNTRKEQGKENRRNQIMKPRTTERQTRKRKREREGESERKYVFQKV